MKAFFRGNPAPVWSRPVGTFEGCRGDPQERSIEMKAKTDPASIGIHRDGEEPGRPESESRAGPASAAWRFRPSAAVLAAFLLGPGAERVAAQDPLFLVDIARGGCVAPSSRGSIRRPAAFSRGRGPPRRASSRGAPVAAPRAQPPSGTSGPGPKARA